MTHPAPRSPALIPPADLTEAQRALYTSILDGPRKAGAIALTDETGALIGPFGAFLMSPAIGDALQRLGAAIRFQTTLPDRVRELAILSVAAHRDSVFEWFAHEAEAHRHGVTTAELAKLREHTVPDPTDATEQCVLELTWALLDDRVGDEFTRCSAALGLTTAYEVVALVGYYSTLAQQMRLLGLDVIPIGEDERHG